MGLPNEVSSALIGAANQGDYTIDQSLRYGVNTSYMIGPSNGTATSNTVGSWSFWWKSTNPSFDNIIMWSEGGGQTQQGFSMNSSQQIRYVYGTTTYFTTSAKYRDPSAWYHFFARKNGATVQLYINGVLAGSSTSAPTTSWNTNRS